MAKAKHYWETIPLEKMSPWQWESLCDGCACCCLLKLEDEDSGEVARTSVGCRLLDTASCLCQDYSHRLTLVPGCVKLTASNLPEILNKQNWLPDSCTYRLVYEGKSLPDWHPLITGSVESVHRAGVSVKGFVVSEDYVHPDQLLDFIRENEK